MSTPNMDISNLIAAVSAGKTQSQQATAQGDSANNGFTTLFEGLRSLLQAETTNLVVDAEQPQGPQTTELHAMPEHDLKIDDELAVLTAHSQPPRETGKHLPVNGDVLPESGMQLPVTLPATEAKLEKTAAESKNHTPIHTAQVVAGQLTVSATPAVQTTQITQPATAQTVQTAELKQTAVSQVPYLKLPQVLTDSSAAVVRQSNNQSGYAAGEAPVIVLPAGFQSAEVTRKATLKSDAVLPSVQPVLDNATLERKPVLSEQLNLQPSRQVNIPAEPAPVVESAEVAQRGTEKTVDNQLATANASRPPAVDRATVVDNVQPLQTVSRAPETMSTTIRPAAVQTAQNTVLLPETIAVRQPGWDQNLGNNILWMVKEDLQSANIRVKPAELGTLNIQISVQQDQLQVNISAHQGAAREALEAALPRLREQFAAQGFQQVNVDISQQQERSSPEQRNDSDSKQNRTEWTTTENQDSQQELSAGLQSQTYHVHDGLLDAFA